MNATSPATPLDPVRWRRNPLLFQIYAIPWCRRFERPEGPTGLDAIPGEELDRVAGLGFDLLWLLGVWKKGPDGLHLARENPAAAEWYGGALPDWTPDDVVGSPFAVAAYDVEPALGGEPALARFRDRLAARGVGLVLDFVPNHTARDHAWVHDHPERYVGGDVSLAEKRPARYFATDTARGRRAIAYGKDPNFDGWSDTAQLDWSRPDVHEAMAAVLSRIATMCDGVRCDMAMLLLQDVFRGTWPEIAPASRTPAPEFWPRAIAGARARHPGFLTIAEVYWGLEGRLLELGFDYVYDKGLYDRLREGHGSAVRAALEAPRAFRSRAVHFIANHDEDPPATAFAGREEGVTALVAWLPGLRFVHESQLDGRTARLPVQLGRNAQEGPDPKRLEWLTRVLDVARWPELRDGEFQPLPITVSAGGGGHESIVAGCWTLGGSAAVFAVNLAGGPARGHVRVPARLAHVVRARAVTMHLPLSGTSEVESLEGLLRVGWSVDLAPHEARVARLTGGGVGR